MRNKTFLVSFPHEASIWDHKSILLKKVWNCCGSCVWRLRAVPDCSWRVPSLYLHNGQTGRVSLPWSPTWLPSPTLRASEQVTSASRIVPVLLRSWAENQRGKIQIMKRLVPVGIREKKRCVLSAYLALKQQFPKTEPRIPMGILEWGNLSAPSNLRLETSPCPKTRHISTKSFGAG